MARAIKRHQSLPTQSAFGQKLCRDPSTNKTAQVMVTSVYQTKIGGHWRNVTAQWGKNLMNYTLSISIDSVLEKNVAHTCKIDLKPWHFWTKKGCKTFDIDGNPVDVYWNLRSVKFSGSPEPCSDYFVALVSEGQMVLLIGDYKKKAYKNTKASPASVDAVLVYKKENVFGRKLFATRATFDDKKPDHEIVVEASISNTSDPEMWISIDGTTLLHIKNLQWKFRGNKTVIVGDQLMQVFWDVHAWLFCTPGTSYGLFIFKLGENINTVVGNGEDHDKNDQDNNDNDDGCGGDATTVKESSRLCLFLYAWKIE